MARDGSGNYSLPAGNPVVTGSTISSTTHNNTMTDIATALAASIAKDGQTTPTADLPMGTYKHTGVGDATARTHYAKVSQIQDGGYITLSSVSGADTITGTVAPAISAYAAGQYFQFVSAGANTGAATLNINSLGAKAITKEGTTALAAGDIASGAVVGVVYDGTRFQLVEGRSVQPLDALLTALAAQTTAAAKIQGYDGADDCFLYDFKDEDNMASDSATAVPSQQSTKAYVDTQVAAVPRLTSVASQATTSGTYKDFVIPAGTKHIIFSFKSLSTSGTDIAMVQLGTGGSPEATGYAGTAWLSNTTNTNFSTGFYLDGSHAAAYIRSGHLILTHTGSNVWVVSGTNGREDAADVAIIGGSKTLAGELDLLRITTVNGTDTFDGGLAGVLCE